jgi:hypothetical protein
MLVESTLADKKDRPARLDQPESGTNVKAYVRICLAITISKEFLGSET